MHLVYYVLIFFISLCSKYFDFETYLFQAAKVTQQLCINQAPSITHSDIWKSMICGAPLNSQVWNQLLKQVGLIHIIVVSGAHLILIHKLLKFLNTPSFLIMCLEIVYCFFTGLQAPVVRAYLYQLKIFAIKSSIKVVVVIQIALSLFPSWFDSISFQMSICACLALNMIEINKARLSFFLYPLIIQLYLFPFLKSFSLTAIFSNIFIAPAYEILLLSFGFTTLVLPTEGLFNLVAESLFTLCQHLNLQNHTNTQTFESHQQWLWIFFLITINWRFQVYILRKKAVKN